MLTTLSDEVVPLQYHVAQCEQQNEVRLFRSCTVMMPSLPTHLLTLQLFVEPCRQRRKVVENRRRVHLFAGQADVADPSHFTLPYDIDGQPGTIDGWLDAYDRVRLQVRDGPAVGEMGP